MGAVRRSPGTIGYGELVYVVQNNVPFGLVRNGEGVFVRASLTSVTAAAEAVLPEVPDDLRFSLADAPGRLSYPIASAVWAVLYADQPAVNRRAVVDFLWWATHEGQEHAEGLGYARLPKGLVERIEKKLKNIEMGK